MNNQNSNPALMSVMTNLSNGEVRGAPVVTSSKTVGDLASYWHDAPALASLDPAAPLYTTESWLPAGEGKEGALAWGNTRLLAGRVGREYFMTRGHFHRKREKGELVVCVSGEGALVLMSEGRETRVELLRPGSTHYVPGHTAHRTANTGGVPLVFLCAWAADCGHDYDEVRERGFSRLLVEVEGAPQLVTPEEKRTSQKIS
ncbi:MAG: cupin domain-containing protein [Acidobacteriota bacterium]|nr:cupin domain-containing protein [Acidobacteriota bacterium]